MDKMIYPMYTHPIGRQTGRLAHGQTQRRARTMSQNQNNDIDLVWEAAAIGRVINRTPRQTHHLLNSGAIEAARKVNGRWCADRNGLRAQFCAGTGQATKRDKLFGLPRSHHYSASDERSEEHTSEL